MPDVANDLRRPSPPSDWVTAERIPTKRRTHLGSPIFTQTVRLRSLSAESTP